MKSSGGILEAISEHQSNKLNRSIAYTEARERIVSQRAEQARALIGGTPAKSEHTEEIELSRLYYRILEEYTGKHNYAIPTYTKRSLALWRRVLKAQQKSGVTKEIYLKAQFHWFDQKFGRAPEMQQLTTDNAIERAKEFAEDKNVNTDRKVLGNNRPVEQSFADIMRQTEKQVRDMCRAQNMTREQFYRNIVIPGIMSLPPQFLQADPVYRRVSTERV